MYRFTLALAAALLAGCAGSSHASLSTAKSAVDDGTPPANRWAALAYGVEWFDRTAGTGNNHFGRAVSEATEYTAKDTAIGACAYETCEIKVFVNIGCISIAHGFENDTGREWYGFGASRLDLTTDGAVATQKHNSRVLAGETAIEGCGGGTLNRFCTVQEAFCTWDVQGPALPAAIAQWVTTMGGEQSPGVYDTLLYLSRAAEPLLRNKGLTYDQARCVVSGTWARVAQVAEACSLTVDQLDTIYSVANDIGGA